MATKKTVKKAPAKAAAKVSAAPKAAAKKVAAKPAKAPAKKVAKAKIANLSGEQLVVENLTTLSALVRTLSETLDVLVQKTENMAYHLIATEEVLAEVVAVTGVDLASVNARIRAKISKGTDKQGDPSRAIDVAAAIASPAPSKAKK